jgi:hypothetical protein
MIKDWAGRESKVSVFFTEEEWVLIKHLLLDKGEDLMIENINRRIEGERDFQSRLTEAMKDPHYGDGLSGAQGG